MDFYEFMNTYKPKKNDFVFLDPPYDSEFSTYAKNEFDKDDQARLGPFRRIQPGQRFRGSLQPD